MRYVIDAGKLSDPVWGTMEIPPSWDDLNVDWQRFVRDGLGRKVVVHGTEINMWETHENFSVGAPLTREDYWNNRGTVWEALTEGLARRIYEFWLGLWGAADPAVQDFISEFDRRYPTPTSRFEREPLV